MDNLTHQVRVERWSKIMEECLASGMNKTAWCKANGIPVKQFFYWQRILREEAYLSSHQTDFLSIHGTVLPADGVTTFAEVKLPADGVLPVQTFQPDLIIRKGSLTIEISNSASTALLSRIGGLLHAE